MSVARRVVSTSRAKGRYSTKLRVITLTAPITLLKKVSPITIHIIVSARTPFSTESSLSRLTSTLPTFYCKRKDWSQPWVLRVSEATATKRVSKMSTDRVR